MSSKYSGEKYTWNPFDADYNRIPPTFEDLGVTKFYDYQQRYYGEYHSLNADHQKEWGKLIDDKKEFVIVNEPRDSGKSVTWSIELPVYKMVQHYNSAGLLVTASDSLSKTYTRAIVDIFGEFTIDDAREKHEFTIIDCG